MSETIVAPQVSREVMIKPDMPPVDGKGGSL